jgi:sugar lactone lactonase YvrE
MEGRGFEYPTDMVAASNGRIYVTNRARDSGERAVRVTALDIESEYYGTFGHHGYDEGRLISPMCIAESRDNRLYVTDDYTCLVSIFALDGSFIARWGDSGSAEGQLNGPSGIAFDAENNAYIVDTHNHRVQRFTADGAFLLAFGSRGAGEGQFEMPWGITVAPGGDLYVADWGNDRIQRFAPDGSFIAAYGRPGRGDGELLRPSSVAVDAHGRMFVADWGNERVQVLDASGAFLQKYRGEATLSKWAANFLQVNKEEGDARATADLEPELDIFDADDPHTQSAHIEKYFWAPMSAKLHGGRLYVVDGNRHRIQVYRVAP